MRENAFRLLTLGRVALVHPDGSEDESLCKRRRKLVLLAVLALAGRPLPRDLLVDMFWGDEDEARARHSLSDALSHLRRSLGRDAISARRSEVSLAPRAPLVVDAIELAAAAPHDPARAVALYAGPFLDGVYVDGSPRFEQWVAGERDRLARLFLKACEARCLALARARQWEECGALAARWLAAAPLSADAALYRLNALKAPGTREADAGALAEYRRIEARLASEYELAPDERVASLAGDIARRLRGDGAARPEAAAAAGAAMVLGGLALARSSTGTAAAAEVPVLAVASVQVTRGDTTYVLDVSVHDVSMHDARTGTSVRLHAVGGVSLAALVEGATLRVLARRPSYPEVKRQPAELEPGH